MMLSAKLFADHKAAKDAPELTGDPVHILQFLHDVDTSRDCHKPVPIAVIKLATGVLITVNINRLRVV